MAFRLSDFGIPNYDSNVNVLYKNAVEHGDSVLCGNEEYVIYRMGNTPIETVLRFTYKEDGETPENVVAHTFLDNAVRWREGVQENSGEQALVMRDGGWLKAEVINPSASGSGYTPMLFADAVRFGPTHLTVGAETLMQEGALVPDPRGGVELLARVVSVKPVVMSRLWLFSMVELALDKEGRIFVPVSRDIMEKQLSTCKEGALCYLNGILSLRKEWA